jgi:hypothetical protein
MGVTTRNRAQFAVLSLDLYILYIYFNHVYHVQCKYLVHFDKRRITADSDSDKQQTRLLVREGAPQKTRPQLSNRKKTSGHEP